ncbi:MAG: filamentous hemagglutinin N-terminal domain-containing protein [Cyanobacteria bacterium P01_D01_bin.156]
MVNRVWLILLQSLSCVFLGLTLPAVAQSISPETGALSTGTQVNQTNNQYDITGGAASGDGANLFHNFNEFSLGTGQTANFITGSEVQNVLGSVLGGASYIDGLLQVFGSSANLYLIRVCC